MAYGVAGLGRFRVNVFQQRGNVLAWCLRVIPTQDSHRRRAEPCREVVEEVYEEHSAVWCW